MTPIRSAIAAFCALLACAASGRADPPQNGEAAPATSATLAVVEGEPITQADVDQAAGPSLAQLREQVYRLERQRLDQLIEERLVAREAARRGMTADALLAVEVRTKATASEEEARELLATRGQGAGAPDAATVERTRTRLKLDRERELRRAFVDELRRRARIDDRLLPPEPYRLPVPADGGRVRGPANAPVTIVEFSDFHCPFCRRVQQTLERLRDRYADRVRLVYRDFPLDELHPQARRAAEAARCAGEQGRFWEFHDRLYRSEADDASDAALRRYADELRLDVAAFEGCLASGRQKATVADDERLGRAVGVSQTPSFFVNGRPFAGSQSFESFSRLIDDELARAGKKADR